MADIDEQLLEDLYDWVDKIPLSRPKKNIQRDFSDGVLVADLIKYYCPKIVDTHNYPAANRVDTKLTNWKLLDRKVFSKLGFEITKDVMNNIANCKPMAVEQFLMMLRSKIDQHLFEKQRDTRTFAAQHSDRPEVDQNISSPGYTPHMGTRKPQKFGGSNQNLSKASGQLPPSYPKTSTTGAGKGDKWGMVPKIEVEEKEQQILVQEETVQILQAKVRRLEHLLHLKDIRIDDLQSRLERMETQLRPTATKKTHMKH